jgi:RNase P/RNase MRP subunit POP5
MSTKEVLVFYKDRRRPVTFESVSDTSLEKGKLYEAVKEAFLDVLPPLEDQVAVFLQIESKEWGLVDVTGSVPDHSTIYLRVLKIR